MKSGFAGFLIVISLILILAVPSLTHAPNTMLFTPQASSAESTAVLHSDSNNISFYNISAPITWHLTDSYTRFHGIYFIYVPKGLNYSLGYDKYNHYNLTFNSYSIGRFNSSSSHLIELNSTWVRSSNFLEFSNNFVPNGTINLIFNLPLKIPAYEIYGSRYFLIYGLFSSSVFMGGVVLVTRFIRKT